jgi:hypothetical protein
LTAVRKYLHPTSKPPSCLSWSRAFTFSGT